jgi:hypothetical protein
MKHFADEKGWPAKSTKYPKLHLIWLMQEVLEVSMLNGDSRC